MLSTSDSESFLHLAYVLVCAPGPATSWAVAVDGITLSETGYAGEAMRACMEASNA